MELFEPHRHEPLKTISWDPDRLEDYAHDILGKENGQLRYSLWTGDLGLVWLNEQLKDRTANLPYLDAY